MMDLQFAPGALDRGALLQALRAYKKGDFSVRLPMDLIGIDGEIAAAFNDVVELNKMFADEIVRIRDEVGKEGRIQQRIKLPIATGVWADGADAVNTLIGDLVQPTAEIARVIESVAKGDLSQTLLLEINGRPLYGEFLRIGKVVNTMVGQLNAFASEVSRVAREVGTEGKLGGQAKVPGAVGLWRDLTDNVNQLAANLTTQVRAIAEVATAVTKGDLTRSIMVQAQGEVAALKDNINEMIRNLKDTTLKNTEQDWLKTNVAKCTRMLQGHRDLVAISRLVLSELAPLVNAQQGVFYARSGPPEEPRLELIASYAHKPNKTLPRALRFGEGLVGQCGYEKKRILLKDVPGDYLRIGSVLGSSAPLNVIILPVVFEGEVKAVIELASFKQFNETHLSFLDQLTESIGIVFNTIEAGMRTEDLLKQSQSLTRELQSQQEELKKTNDRLEQQADNLQRSEALLKKQQEELQGTNEQLQDKAKLLSEQMRQVEYKNREVEQGKAALEEKAEQLALSSRYKSEFLANMSHELRTPLNSLLILAKLLADNTGNNLNPKQIEYADTIYAAGTDLLSLISDILDLAKIESGTVTLNVVPERFSDLRDYVERTFRQVADSKQLGFTVAIDAALPPFIQTDVKRLQQILKNLLSNAFKFTHQGKVLLEIAPATSGWTPGHARLGMTDAVVAFSVTDTGAGIPADKQKIIFEAFQQADGTTSRQYGGTGLGLSISRELTRLLGGEVRVSSTPGKGSTFTLYLPLVHKAVADKADTGGGMAKVTAIHAGKKTGAGAAAEPLSVRSTSTGHGNGTEAEPGERIALMVEDDAHFAASLLEIAEQAGFKGVVARDADTALVLAKQLAPDAITLDLRVPDMDGWAVLDLLKRNPQTRCIPVSVISVDDRMRKCFHMGTLGIVNKPEPGEALQQALSRIRGSNERALRTLFVANGEETERKSIVSRLSSDGIDIAAVVGTGQEALEVLREGRFDCVVASAQLPDMSSGDLLKKFAKNERAAGVPVVMYGANGSGGANQDEAHGLAEIVLVQNVSSRESVLEETRRFLRHTAANPVERKQKAPLARQKIMSVRRLSGRKVLIVDDDVRNIFALAGALEQHGMTVLTAENGRDAIDTLKQNPDSDAVLMDIMMPELDGYDTIRVIRGMDQFRRLPIIAITARAMLGDREKCLEAGASDYIAKPIDVEQLLAMLESWSAEGRQAL